MALLLPGYSGAIWNAAKASISYANTNLSPSASPQQTKVLAQAVATTLRNAVTAIDMYLELQGLQNLFANLSSVVPLQLGLDPITQAYLDNRVNAIQAASISLAPLLVSPLPVVSQLSAGRPAIPYPGYLEWLINFDFESAPGTGMFTESLVPVLLDGTPGYLLVDSDGFVVNLQDTAQGAATAWQTIATAMRQSGVVYTGAAYNSVILMGQCSQVVATLLINMSVASNAPGQLTWNQLVTMPSVTRAVAAIVNDPTSITSQDTAVVRYVMLNALQEFNRLIVSLRDVVPTAQVKLGTVRQGDSLMSFANRELNDYTLWRQVAEINGLQPPYITSTPTPLTASPGQQLFLPQSNSGSASPAVATTSVPSYTINYLGVDRFLGPINQSMLPWTGDYQSISGYQNLSFSLGRRLQTTLGNLIYHNLFGCRIPPEIGKVESSNELAIIKRYAISCLRSDPRVNKIISCDVTQGRAYSIFVNAVVLPNGLGQKELTVNEVLGPI